jgi:hypothetical protein
MAFPIIRMTLMFRSQANVFPSLHALSEIFQSLAEKLFHYSGHCSKNISPATLFPNQHALSEIFVSMAGKLFPL